MMKTKFGLVMFGILACMLLMPLTAQATPFDLGDASSFAILGDSHTYEVGNNSQITGNIGVGPSGRLKLSGGPFSLTGNIYFADAVVPGTNYITSGTNNISGVVAQNQMLVSSALSALNTLYTTAFSVYANPGTTNLAPSGSVTINVGNYNYQNVNINSDTITFSGTATDYIIINVQKELKINNSTFNLTGGITPDHILWNLIKSGDGGDATKNLTVSGADTEFAGVFLALDRKISLGDNDGIGRFFGGNSAQSDDDFRFVSGVTIIPLPPSAFLLGSGLLGLVGWRRFRQR